MPQLRRQTHRRQIRRYSGKPSGYAFCSRLFLSPALIRLPALFEPSYAHPIKRDFWLSAEKSLKHREYGFHCARCARGLLNGSDIKAPVLRKFLIFCGNHRQSHPRRDLIHTDPVRMCHVTKIAMQRALTCRSTITAEKGTGATLNNAMPPPQKMARTTINRRRKRRTKLNTVKRLLLIQPEPARGKPAYQCRSPLLQCSAPAYMPGW